MDREAMDALRYDRRLARRRGWIADDELSQAEAALPDAQTKAMTLGDAADVADGESGAQPAGATAPPAQET